MRILVRSTCKDVTRGPATQESQQIKISIRPEIEGSATQQSERLKILEEGVFDAQHVILGRRVRDTCVCVYTYIGESLGTTSKSDTCETFSF